MTHKSALLEENSPISPLILGNPSLCLHPSGLPWVKSSQFCLLTAESKTNKKNSFLPFWWLNLSLNMGGGPDSMRPSTGNGRKKGENPPSFSSSHKQLARAETATKITPQIFPFPDLCSADWKKVAHPLSLTTSPSPDQHRVPLTWHRLPQEQGCRQKKQSRAPCPAAHFGLCKHSAWEKSFICKTSCSSWLPNPSPSCQVFFFYFSALQLPQPWQPQLYAPLSSDRTTSQCSHC